MSSLSGIINGATISNNIFNAPSTYVVNFVKPSPAGDFSGVTIGNNAFIRVSSFVIANGGASGQSIISGNMFSGDASPTLALTHATLTGNYFGFNPTSGITPKAVACSNNTGYGCVLCGNCGHAPGAQTNYFRALDGLIPKTKGGRIVRSP